MFKFAVLATIIAGSLNSTRADEVKEKATATTASQPVLPAAPAKVAPSFSRWIEREKLTAPKPGNAWISGEVDYRRSTNLTPHKKPSLARPPGTRSLRA